MMRWNDFGRALVFAAVAAAGLLVAEPLLSPWIGARGALRFYTVAIAALYLVGLGPSWRRGFVAAGAATGMGLVLLALPFGVASTAAGAAGIVAVCRSGLLYRARPFRSVLAESMLGGGGLALAGFVASGGLVSLALAVWAYFLVQGGFFLIGGIRIRDASGPDDPFDRAAAEIQALLH